MVKEGTIQYSTCAVVVPYEADRESVPRVVGPKTTTPNSTCAVEVLYEANRESLLRVVGPKHTTPDSTIVVVGECVEMLISCRNYHLMKISYQIKLYFWTSNLSVRTLHLTRAF